MAHVKLKADHFVKAPSYIIFVEAGVTKALNCRTQAIESGIDASEIIQSAINALLPQGGKIFIKRGTYEITKTIELPKNRPWSPHYGAHYIIEGEGRASLLKMADGISLDWAILRLDNVERCVVKNLGFDGNKGTGTKVGEGLLSVLIAEQNIIMSCFFKDSPQISLCLDASVFGCLVTNNVIMNGGAESGAIYLFDDVNFNSIVGNTVINSGYGIFSQASRGNVYVGNVVRGGVYGFRNFESPREMYVGNSVIEPDDSCFFADRPDYSIIKSNYFKGKVDTTHRGVRVYQPKGVHIIGNLFEDFTLTTFDDRGIWLWGEDATYRDSLVTLNRFVNVAQPVLHTPPYSLVRRNVGYLTENSGTATFTAGVTSVTISHGLATTPKIVLVTPHHSEIADIRVIAKTATDFTVEVSTAPTADRTFDWYTEV